ncbi:MAG: thiamine diphosphokinase [Eubacterium sp.]|nr:thiamine diphosphokinase [Eubacterium sp.]
MKIIMVAAGNADKNIINEYYTPEKTYLVGIDGGTRFILDAGLVPDLFVGDMDSLIISDEERIRLSEAECVKLVPEKDDTDTEHAVRLILERLKSGWVPAPGRLDDPAGISVPDEPNDLYDQDNDGAMQIIILGATGTRLDHTFANINLLKLFEENGINAFIRDEHNRIRVAGKNICLKKAESFGKYFSLLPFTDEVKGLSIKGAKYELDDYILTRGTARCVSNEYTEGDVFISFESGSLIVIESVD